MPTYSYRCKSCGHEFEEWQPMSAAQLTDCPSCRQPNLVRLLGGAGLIFKGSGFYLTDYKNASKPTEKARDTKTPEVSSTEKTDSAAVKTKAPKAD